MYICIFLQVRVVLDHLGLYVELPMSLNKFKCTVIMTNITQYFFSKSIKFHATPIEVPSIRIDEMR